MAAKVSLTLVRFVFQFWDVPKVCLGSVAVIVTQTSRTAAMQSDPAVHTYSWRTTAVGQKEPFTGHYLSIPILTRLLGVAVLIMRKAQT